LALQADGLPIEILVVRPHRAAAHRKLTGRRSAANWGHTTAVESLAEVVRPLTP
jgi:hypothetical protein